MSPIARSPDSPSDERPPAMALCGRLAGADVFQSHNASIYTISGTPPGVLQHQVFTTLQIKYCTVGFPSLPSHRYYFTQSVNQMASKSQRPYNIVKSLFIITLLCNKLTILWGK